MFILAQNRGRPLCNLRVPMARPELVCKCRPGSGASFCCSRFR